jgi:hypothetical protein
LTISRIVGTESRRWVSPIAQQTIVAGESANRRPVDSISGRVSPVDSTTSSQFKARKEAT